jgi:hypothetical protein
MILERLHSDRIVLRQARLSDIPRLTESLSDQKVNRWLVRVPKPYREEHAHQWVKSNSDRIKKGEALPYSIEHIESGILIGGISLNNINQRDKSAELGYWIARDYWGEGYATEGVRLLCRYGFNKLSLHRIYAWVHSENTGSFMVLEKIGFRREGVCQKASNVTGRWKDDYLYGLLKTDLN